MATSSLVIERVPCLSDNYAWVLHEPTQKLTAVVDPSESSPVQALLSSKWVRVLGYCLITCKVRSMHVPVKAVGGSTSVDSSLEVSLLVFTL